MDAIEVLVRQCPTHSYPRGDSGSEHQEQNSYAESGPSGSFEPRPGAFPFDTPSCGLATDHSRGESRAARRDPPLVPLKDPSSAWSGDVDEPGRGAAGAVRRPLLFSLSSA